MGIIARHTGGDEKAVRDTSHEDSVFKELKTWGEEGDKCKTARSRRGCDRVGAGWVEKQETGCTDRSQSQITLSALLGTFF